MKNVTLISTVHNIIGECNPIELCKIFQTINPDVIFLEAFEKNYSEYQKLLFSQFGVFSDRLELHAIQIYSQQHTFTYVPVLDVELSADFEAKTQIVSQNEGFRKIFDSYTLLETTGGFKFLNSEKGIRLQDEMKELENDIIKDRELLRRASESIDAYENSMIRNIYSFCKENLFADGIFMCGSAHRKTIVEKIIQHEKNSDVKLNWKFYKGEN